MTQHLVGMAGVGCALYLSEAGRMKSQCRGGCVSVCEGRRRKEKPFRKQRSNVADWSSGYAGVYEARLYSENPYRTGHKREVVAWGAVSRVPAYQPAEQTLPGRSHKCRANR